MLHKQRQELQRLKFLDKAVNNMPHSKIKQANSYLQGRSDTKQSRSRSKKSNKRVFVHEGEYQLWTNAFSRKSLWWDEQNNLLEQEKELVEREDWKQDKSQCCGNSPGKSHKQYCRYVCPDDQA